MTVLLNNRIPLANFLLLLLVGSNTLSLLRDVLGQRRLEHFIALVGLGEHLEQFSTLAGYLAVGLAQGVQDLKRLDLVN